jgi:transcriptional regulator with XRE-family HTH domain
VSKVSSREIAIDRLMELLRQERLRKKLSLNEVATRAGLSHTMVMRVEKRERLPTIDTLLRITDAMGIKLSPLIAKATKAAGSSQP